MIRTVRHVTQNRPVWEHAKSLHAHRHVLKHVTRHAHGHVTRHAQIPAGQHAQILVRGLRVRAHATHLNARGQNGLAVTIHKSFPPATGLVARVHLFSFSFSAHLTFFHTKYALFKHKYSTFALNVCS
jgi:hypothetical protein